MIGSSVMNPTDLDQTKFGAVTIRLTPTFEDSPICSFSCSEPAASCRSQAAVASMQRPRDVLGHKVHSMAITICMHDIYIYMDNISTHILVRGMGPNHISTIMHVCIYYIHAYIHVHLAKQNTSQ